MSFLDAVRHAGHVYKEGFMAAQQLEDSHASRVVGHERLRHRGYANVSITKKPTLEGAGFGMLGGKLQFFDNGGVRGILADRSDTGVHRALGGVHLAGTDDLAVGSLEIEERLAVLGDLDFISVGIGGILLHRLHTVEARGLRGVTFAGENDLAVGGLEIELEFTVLTESNDKFSHGFVFYDVQI